MKKAQLEKIKNFVLVEPVSLKNHKITAYNNIKTITVDITNTDWKKGSKSSGSDIISWIIRASGGTAQKLIVYAKSSILTGYGLSRKPLEVSLLIDKLTRTLGPALKPKWKSMPDQDLQCWIWEDLDGLRCSTL